ncbi:putative hydroxymethylpyrimidine transport system substrate-binding protein [Bacillus sp. OV322]|uniref:ABC transporter substrate-binding protein n=1 Tax=Bacillus sp. OV322 TaxID=1882764 RepID=UPI0008F3BCDA|nr:ABC transporter substrate-binding protein [Bacillus sp. OV322]SFC72392.1 putative hydroxymethylpyrimidine transport system substrate-binding protein [Bacillus sp. OV322]
MKKLCILFLVLTLTLMSGCSDDNQAGKKQSNNHLQKVSLMLDWYPNAVHSFLYAAKEKGYFKEQGLDVDIKMPADTNDPLRLVAAGKMDLAISYQPEVIIARSQHIQVKSIGAIVRHPLNTLLVPAGGKVKSPRDLEGKLVGYPSIPLDEAIVHTMVKNDGGNPQKVKMADVGYDLIPALAAKKTDGLIGGYVNHEKLLLEKEGHNVRSFNPSDYGVPDYYELVLVASDKGLKERTGVYKKFMSAINKGQEFVQKNPDKGLSILLKHEEKTSPLEKDIETKSLNILLPLMDAKKRPFGYQEPSSWDRVAKWLHDSKVIKSNIKASDAFKNI